MSNVLFQALRNPNGNPNENDTPIHLIFNNHSINLYLVKFFKIHNLATVKYKILEYIDNNLNNTFSAKPFTLNVELFEASCNQDCMLHVLSIMRDVHERGLLVKVNIVAEFDPELVELLGDESVCEVTWGMGSYISFEELKDTARKLFDGNMSSYGKVFIPRMVSKLRESFEVDLSDVDSFNDIYIGDEMLEILKPKLKDKSIVVK